MGDTRLPDYPGSIGPKNVVVVDHTGPTSYTTGGETIGTTNLMTGISVVGLSGLDIVLGTSISVSGTYLVIPKPVGTGLRKTCKLVWCTLDLTAGTIVQVANATDLHLEVVKLMYTAR